MPWGVAAVGIGMQLKGSSDAKSAAKSGAKKLAKEGKKMKKEAFAESEAAYGEQKALLGDWVDAGKRSLATLEEGIASGKYDPGKFHFDYASFEKDPGYAFRIKEGGRMMEQGAAARGKLLSGQQQKALLGYGQEMGSQEYQNSFNRAAQEWGMNANRLQNNFNMLNSLNQQGLSAASGLSNARQDLAQNKLGAIYGNSNIQRAAIGQKTAANVASANALSSLGSQIAGYGMGSIGGGGGASGGSSTASAAQPSGGGASARPDYYYGQGGLSTSYDGNNMAVDL